MYMYILKKRNVVASFPNLLGVQKSYLEHLIGVLMYGGEVSLVPLPLQLHHHGNHVHRLLVEVIIWHTLRGCARRERGGGREGGRVREEERGREGVREGREGGRWRGGMIHKEEKN